MTLGNVTSVVQNAMKIMVNVLMKIVTRWIFSGGSMEEKKIYPVCKRCGRKLRSEETRERGMGKVCWEKSQHTSKIRLFHQGGHNNELSQDNQN
jgi:hypothetical protein